MFKGNLHLHSIVNEHFVKVSIEDLYQRFKKRLADEAALNVWPDRDDTTESDWDWLEKRLEEGVRDKPNLKKLLSEDYS